MWKFNPLRGLYGCAFILYGFTVALATICAFVAGLELAKAVFRKEY